MADPFRTRALIAGALTLLAACGGGDPPSASGGDAGRMAAAAAAGFDDDDDSEDDEDTMNPCTRSLAILFASAALVACGGGGGDAGSPPPAPSPTPPPPPGPAPAPAPNAGVAGEIVVQLNTGASVAAVANDFDLAVLDRFGKRPIWRLKAAAGTNVNTKIAALLADTRVRYAEVNAENETPESRRRSLWAVGGDSGSYATQWAPAAIRLDQAHLLSRGAGIRVAVLDTGIDRTHPALAPLLARTGTGALLGRDFVDDDADPSEGGTDTDLGYGHGTHVAGLVALVAPQARLMPARVLDAEGRGNVWVLAEALLWAVDPDADPFSDDGAHVVNLSLGTTRRTNLLTKAVALADCDFDDDDDDFADPGFDDDKQRCANKLGAAVIAAAGNGGSTTELQYPAAEAPAVPGSLAIGASDEERRLAAFSNRGSWVQLAAPGDKIISTFPGGGYATWSGTSMAAPLAAGTVALVAATYADKRGVVPLEWTKKLLERTQAMCGGTTLRELDAAGAVSGIDPPAEACP